MQKDAKMMSDVNFSSTEMRSLHCLRLLAVHLKKLEVPRVERGLSHVIIVKPGSAISSAQGFTSSEF